MAAAASGSLEVEENREPERGGVVEELSLQMELKIARRDDVIRFPQHSTPPLTHTQAWACMHAHPHTHTQGREAPGSQGHRTGKSGECIC